MDTETIRAEYIKRNNISVMSSDDERLVNAIAKVRNKYAEELQKRKTTKMISIDEITNICEKQVIKSEPKTKTKKETEVVFCQATKMDGNKCTAKAKPGCVFCGRHLPKDK